MAEKLKLHYDVDGQNFTSAGEAWVQVKKKLRQMGFSPDVIRRVSIAMYEGEINMVIHAGGGEVDVVITPDCIDITLEDHGPGIADIPLAMKEGYSTAPDNVRHRLRSRNGTAEHEALYRRYEDRIHSRRRNQNNNEGGRGLIFKE